MEEKQLRVESVLKKCSLEEIQAIAEGLEMPENTWKDQTKETVFRRLQAVFDTIQDEEALYKKMLGILQCAPSTILDQLMTILIKTPKTEAVQGTVPITDSTSKFLREFKISGTIGGDVDKDNLTYISLCSQILEGRKKGYSDEEMAAAVRKACSPTTNLRSYFDSKLELPLESIVSFIPLFYEKSHQQNYFRI